LSAAALTRASLGKGPAISQVPDKATLLIRLVGSKRGREIAVGPGLGPRAEWRTGCATRRRWTWTRGSVEVADAGEAADRPRRKSGLRTMLRKPSKRRGVSSRPPRGGGRLGDYPRMPSPGTKRWTPSPAGLRSRRTADRRGLRCSDFTTGLWYQRLCRAASSQAVTGAMSRPLGRVIPCRRLGTRAITALPENHRPNFRCATCWPMAQLLEDTARS